MIKILEKATFKLEKVLLVDLVKEQYYDKNEYDDYFSGGYAVYTYDDWGGEWTKQEYFKYEGFVDDAKGWGNIYDNVALPRFKDYCLAMFSEME